MGAYDRVTFRGHTFDRMTVAAIEHAESFLGVQVRIMQGSYNGGGGAVSASAGTHDGGGAVDIDILGVPGKSTDEVQHAFRLAGFAFWDRPTLPGEWVHHGHGILIGNARVADSARKQVQDYYAHLNGLADHAHDGSWRPNPVVAFRYPLGLVDHSHLVAESKKKSGQKPHPGVKHVQRALNLKTGTSLLVDGIYGPVTKAAYGRYEKQNGGNGDGVPTKPFILRRLGAARFRVKD